MGFTTPYSLFQKTAIFLFLLCAGMLLLGLCAKAMFMIQGEEGVDLTVWAEDIGNHPVQARILVVLQQVMIFILLPFLYSRIVYQKPSPFLSFTWPGYKDIAIFFGFLFLMYPLLSILTLWVNLVEWPVWMNDLDDSYVESLQSILGKETIWEMLMTIVIVAVIPAIGEELFFRGIIQKELSQVIKNHHLAIWTTAVIFAAVHFQVTGFPAKCMIGLALGYAYYFTKSLWVPVFLHAINNAAAAIAMFTTEEVLTREKEQVIFQWSQLSVALIFLLLILWYYQFFILKHYQENGGS